MIVSWPDEQRINTDVHMCIGRSAIRVNGSQIAICLWIVNPISVIVVEDIVTGKCSLAARVRIEFILGLYAPLVPRDNIVH